MNKHVSLIADLLDLLDVERRYEFEERAGIIEFDGGQLRDQAEVLALVDLLRAHPTALLPLTALKVRRFGSSATALATDVDAARDQLSEAGFALLDIVNLAETVKVQFGGLAVLRSFHHLM